MTEIRASCSETERGWTCVVDLRDPDGSSTSHDVMVTSGDVERLASGASDPTDLVTRSFAFLLEREPKGSILTTFELSAIGRYFPEYERTIAERG